MFLRLATVFAIIATVLVTTTHAQLPAPRLYALSQVGGQAGTSFDVTIASGVDTDDARALLFSHPGITAVAKTLPSAASVKTPVKLEGQFTITIAKDVPPGVYEVRVSAAMGITNARAFLVSDLPESRDPGNNRTIDTAAPIALNTVVNGNFTARQVNYYKLPLKQNQRVMFDLKAERIDSRGNAVLTLHDAAGRELVRQRAGNGLDPFIDFTAPADGDFLIAVNDLTFGGGEQFFYRLTARTGPYIDSIFPPAGLPGTKAKFTLLGRNLPGSTKSDFLSVDGQPLEALSVEIDIPAEGLDRSEIDTLVLPAEAATDAFVWRFTSPQGISNPVRIGFAAAPVTLETEPNDDPAKATKVTIPCEIAGRFFPRSDRDWFAFDAKKGDVLWIDVHAQRIGTPADASLLIQHVKTTDKGEEVRDVQVIDDMAQKSDPRFTGGNEDPSARFVVPDDGHYRIVVRDQYLSGRDDPRRAYRLTILPESADGSVPHAARPDFRLVIAPPIMLPAANNRNTYEPSSTVVRRGGTDDLGIIVMRQGGFAGEIDVSVENLPAGVTCPPVTLHQGVDSATLVFTAALDAPAWSGLVRIVGKATVQGKPLVREARGAQIVWGQVQDRTRGWSRVAGSIALSVIDTETVPFTVTLDGPLTSELSRSGKWQVPVKVTRREGFAGPVKITAAGIPNGPVTGKELNIAADKVEGILEIEAKNNAPLQGFALVISAQSPIQYARMPKLAESLNAQKKELEDSIKQLTEESKKAVEAAKAAAQAAKETQEAHAKAQAPEQAESQKKVDAATQAKADADAAAKKAEDELKLAAEMLKAIDAQAKKATDGAKPKAVTLTQPVGTIDVRVLETPIRMEPVADVKVKAAGMAEQVVKVARHSGFDGDVTFELVLPAGVTGITLAAPAVAKKDEGEAKLNIAATDKATPGEHVVTIRAKLNFGGNMQVDTPVKITVEP